MYFEVTFKFPSLSTQKWENKLLKNTHKKTNTETEFAGTAFHSNCPVDLSQLYQPSSGWELNHGLISNPEYGECHNSNNKTPRV